jgi:hypothetical protein
VHAKSTNKTICESAAKKYSPQIRRLKKISKEQKVQVCDATEAELKFNRWVQKTQTAFTPASIHLLYLLSPMHWLHHHF